MASSLKNVKNWQSGVAKYLQKMDLASNEIHADIVARLGDDTPGLSIVQK